jgi:hypothetical protein
LVVLLEKYHDVKITDEKIGKKVLYSINTMTEYILEEKEKNK